MAKVIMMSRGRRGEFGFGNAPSAFRAARLAGVMAMSRSELSQIPKTQTDEVLSLPDVSPSEELVDLNNYDPEHLKDREYDDNLCHAVGKKAIEFLKVYEPEMAAV